MIREVQTKDAKQIADIYRYYVENSTATFETVPLSKEEFLSKIKKFKNNYPWLVYEEEGKVVGYAYAGKFKEKPAYNTTVELTIYFHKDYCKKGYGKELSLALLEELKKYSYYLAYVCITYPNTASQKLTESLGFECVGIFKNIGRKNGKWLSVIDYIKPIKEFD
ncbi:MAG: N-acetyltransferase family protein [Eubacteriaceae bacterium]